MALAIQGAVNGLDLLISAHRNIRAELDGRTRLNGLRHIGRIVDDHRLARVHYLGERTCFFDLCSRYRFLGRNRLHGNTGAFLLLRAAAICHAGFSVGRRLIFIRPALPSIARRGDLIGRRGYARAHLLGKRGHSRARTGKDKRHEHDEEFPRTCSDVVEHPFPLGLEDHYPNKNRGRPCKGKRGTAKRPHLTACGNAPASHTGCLEQI